MNNFDRNLGRTGASETSALQQLKKLTDSIDDNWWKDLLRAWIPAGYGGNNPMRLAVRNGYLNFYLRGQSVARVGFGHGRVPFAETHIKFASPEDGETRKGYVRLAEGEFRISSTKKLDWRYAPKLTLRQWLDRADKRGRRKNNDSFAEKTFVDRVVAKNGRVIDLEMGLPAWKGSKTAKRMDLVSLEPFKGHLRIVFWEAKTISDSRLVSIGDPEVKKQFANYCGYLASEDQAQQVIKAYRKNCSVLIELHCLAQRVRADIEPLDETIIQAATAKDGEISICNQPRLIVFDNRVGNHTKSWPDHKEKLRDWLGSSFKVLPTENYDLW